MLSNEPQAREPSAASDRLLRVAEAAQRIGIARDTLYRNADDYPFTRRPRLAACVSPNAGSRPGWPHVPRAPGRFGRTADIRRVDAASPLRSLWSAGMRIASSLLTCVSKTKRSLRLKRQEKGCRSAWPKLDEIFSSAITEF
jgi:hypothetical protein